MNSDLAKITLVVDTLNKMKALVISENVEILLDFAKEWKPTETETPLSRREIMIKKLGLITSSRFGVILSENQIAEWVDLILSQNKLMMVKSYKDIVGCGLKEAKETMDEIAVVHV
jgi:ribosomal protein L7/L12